MSHPFMLQAASGEVPDGFVLRPGSKAVMQHQPFTRTSAELS
jgi:hypothetical protein